MKTINENYLGQLEAKIIELRKTERSIEEHQRALEVLNKRGSSALGVVLYTENNNPNSKPYPFIEYYAPSDQRLTAALVEPVKVAISEELETLKKEQQDIIAQYFTPGGAD